MGILVGLVALEQAIAFLRILRNAHELSCLVATRTRQNLSHIL